MNTIERWPGGLVVNPGNYITIDGLSLNVWIDKQQIVHYSLEDKMKKLLFTSTERPSAFHRWLLFFDENRWVWFISSDIGSYVAKPSADAYEQLSVDKNLDLVKAMPAPLFNRLPRSLRKEWQTHRNVQ